MMVGVRVKAMIVRSRKFDVEGQEIFLVEFGSLVLLQ